MSLIADAWYAVCCCQVVSTVIFHCVRDAPPVIPTTAQHGYKQMKAKIGQSRVRPWKWMPFTNPARKACFDAYEHFAHSASVNSNIISLLVTGCSLVVHCGEL